MVDMVRIDSSSSLFFLQTCSYNSTINMKSLMLHTIHAMCKHETARRLQLS
jgi:hypothetical protein